MTTDHETTCRPHHPRNAIGRRLAAAGMAMIVATLIAACGGDDGAPPSTAGASATTAASPTGDNVDDGECPLTAEDVSAVVGVAVTDFGCAWTSDSGDEEVGPDDLRVDVFYNSYPASLFATYREQAEDRSDVVDVEGVGDEAYSVADSGLAVLAGELAFDIHVAAHSDTDLDLDAAERELAVLILRRLT